MTTAGAEVRAGRTATHAERSVPDVRRQRPYFRWSDIWKAPLQDFPVRDEILYQYLSLSPEMEVLEVGPGSGLTAFRLARKVRHLTLLDVSSEAIAGLKSALKDCPNLAFVCSDVTRPGLFHRVERKFDAVFALDVFEYLADPAASLCNLAEVLHPRGELLLTYPNVPPPEGDGVTCFSKKEDLEGLLNRAGFREWEIFAVRLRPFAAVVYQLLHQWPANAYRWLRNRGGDVRPQTYEGTWTFRHGRRLWAYRLPLQLFWLALGWTLRLGGEAYITDGAEIEILGRQLVIHAWR